LLVITSLFAGTNRSADFLVLQFIALSHQVALAYFHIDFANRLSLFIVLIAILTFQDFAASINFIFS
jgi:hypothetical protein